MNLKIEKENQLNKKLALPKDKEIDKSLARLTKKEKMPNLIPERKWHITIDSADIKKVIIE